MKPWALDLFCGAGGVAKGLQQAGFAVVGVDIEAQPRYCGEHFVRADAMQPPVDLRRFDFIWASPPCQGYSIMRNLPWLRDREYPMLIPAVRAMLNASGRPWAIENVAGARKSKRHPEGLQAGFLCGSQFGLPIFRHRYFETSFFWLAPAHRAHDSVISPGRMLGDRAREPVTRKTGQRYGFDRPGAGVGHGNAGGLSARDAIGVPWMRRDEATQAIPPAYSEFIGRAALQHLRAAA